MPLLKLSEEGVKQLKGLQMVGGRHWKRVMEMVKEEQEVKLEKMEESLKVMLKLIH